VAVQDSVEEPEPPVITVGLRLQWIPVVGDVELVRFTVPANPLVGLTVIVEVSAELTFPVTPVGLAEMVKSSITNVAVVEWVRVPLVPVIVRMYDPAVVELQDTDAEPELETLPGEMGPQFRPAGIESVSVTVPVKPFREFTDIVEVARILTSTGPGELALMLKSVTVTVTLDEWDNVPLAPVMVKL